MNPLTQLVLFWLAYTLFAIAIGIKIGQGSQQEKDFTQNKKADPERPASK